MNTTPAVTGTRFDDVVKMVKETFNRLGEEFGQQALLEYVPSILGKDGTSVTLLVTKGDPLWTPELERRIREHVEAFRDATGARSTLKVDYV